MPLNQPRVALSERACYDCPMNFHQQFISAIVRFAARRVLKSADVRGRALSHSYPIGLIWYTNRIQFGSKCVTFPKSPSYEELQNVTECDTFPRFSLTSPPPSGAHGRPGRCPDRPVNSL